MSGAGASELSRGYALLHELVSKQSGLHGALVMGGLTDETERLIREIDQASGEAAEKLRSFAEADPSLVLDDAGLPEVEAEARDAMEAKATRRLLFAGRSFELRLLLTQTDATNYGATLAREVAELETDKVRREWLEGFAERYEKLRGRVEDRLGVRGK